MEKKDLEAIAEVIIKHDLYVISDEIYAELSYKEKHVSIKYPFLLLYSFNPR